MTQRGRFGTSQRWLDLCLGLPVAAPEEALREALARHSPFLSPATRAVRLSEMRTYTHPQVRANIATIAAYAARCAEPPGTTRYGHQFYWAACRVKNGEALP